MSRRGKQTTIQITKSKIRKRWLCNTGFLHWDTEVGSVRKMSKGDKQIANNGRGTMHTLQTVYIVFLLVVYFADCIYCIFISSISCRLYIVFLKLYVLQTVYIVFLLVVYFADFMYCIYFQHNIVHCKQLWQPYIARAVKNHYKI